MNAKGVLALLVLLDFVMLASVPIYPHVVDRWNGPGWETCTQANDLCGGIVNSTGISVCFQNCYTYTVEYHWTLWRVVSSWLFEAFPA